MSPINLIFSAFAACLLVLAPVRAEESALGPAVGEALPHDLSAPTAFGEDTNAEALMGENGMALFFSRSVDWCPYCQAEAVEINNNYAEFEALGISVVFVTYDAQDKQQKFIQRTDFQPTLLSDPEAEIINAFGIRNETYGPESKAYGIPHPLVLIVSPDQIVRAKRFEEDFQTNKRSYVNRPTVSEVLEAIDEGLNAEA
ncbi:MAG: peroxiredoxin family protein [Pseudomonadota bacterium]